MTPYEIDLASALRSCSFPGGHPHKRFCRNIAEIARHSPDKELSLRQRHYMEIMAWRYRRQLPARFVPPSKPLDLPVPIKAPGKGRAKKPEPEANPDLFGGGGQI